MLQPAELRLLLTALEGKEVEVVSQSAEKAKVKLSASPALRAMVLLGCNCGFGQSDVAALKTSHVDLAAGIVEFPRVKTAVERRCVLWQETADAIRDAIAARPVAKAPDDDDCIFLTRFGRRWVTVSNKGGVTDTVGASFSRALAALALKRHRLNFYCLRHVTETVGAQVKDQPALDYLMGHVNPTMGANYVEEIGDDRLRSIADHIHAWLFSGEGGAK
jgi:integrase